MASTFQAGLCLIIIFLKSDIQLLSGLILIPAIAEFGFNPPYLSLALNTGLFVGAVVWGIGCDVWGRRWSFNITLFLAGVFGIASGGSANFTTLASLFAVCGFGVGGNLPVDSAVFLGYRSAFRPPFLLSHRSRVRLCL